MTRRKRDGARDLFCVRILGSTERCRVCQLEVFIFPWASYQVLRRVYEGTFLVKGVGQILAFFNRKTTFFKSYNNVDIFLSIQKEMKESACVVKRELMSAVGQENGC